MKTFAVKTKRTVKRSRGPQPSCFGFRGPEVKAQQTKIHYILRSTGAHAKLTIDQPNDKYKPEADCVADQVMAMPDPKLQRQPETGEAPEVTPAIRSHIRSLQIVISSKQGKLWSHLD